MKRKSITVLLTITLVATLVFVVNAFGYTYEPMIDELLNEVHYETIISAPERVPNSAVPKQLERPTHWVECVQDYLPGSVRLFENPQDVFGGSLERIPQRRIVFYRIDGFIIDLVSQEEWLEFQNSVLAQMENFDTMPLVKFIQHFNISRETLEFAITQLSEARGEVIYMIAQEMLEEQGRKEMMLGHSEIAMSSDAQGLQVERDYTSWPWYDPWADPMHEINEIPNLDIVFTFDNDIISWYYRRA